MRLVSINNQEIANYTSPTLSSYDINKDELAKRGIHAVGGHSMGRSVNQHMRISTKLVARDSFTPKAR